MIALADQSDVSIPVWVWVALAVIGVAVALLTYPRRRTPQPITATRCATCHTNPPAVWVFADDLLCRVCTGCADHHENARCSVLTCDLPGLLVRAGFRVCCDHEPAQLPYDRKASA